MKKFIYLFAFLLLTTTGFAQITVHQELGQAWGGGSSVDINNDGYLDFYITGNKNNPKGLLLDEAGNTMDLNDDSVPDSTERWQRMFFWNPNTQTYDSVGTNLRIVDRANMDWADIDGDGLLDLIAAEHSFDDPFYHAGVYKNMGTGMFEKLDYPIATKTNAVAWADFNNDGMLDYVCIGVELGASGVYINQGDGIYVPTNTDVFGEYQFGLGYCEVIDYNNDGFMDIFVTANCDNPDANDGARVIADVFINYNEEPGNFYRAFLGKTASNTGGSIYMKGNGGVDFADLNGDGWMDMVLHGEGGEGTLEPTSGDVWACISHVYINQKDGTFTEKAQSAFQPDLRPLSSTGVGTGIIDWNNDGYWDLFITGWNPPTLNTQAGYLYYGDAAGNFTEFGRVPGASETIILFNDWNNDGFPDYLVSGHSWDPMFYATEDVQGRTGAVMLNSHTGTPNARPGAPTGLAATVDGGMVTLNWNEATDDKTPAKSLTYEYYLKDGDGNFMIAPSSVLAGNDMDGHRKIIKQGNNFLNKFVKLMNLPNGDYTWGVQSIDSQYKGSLFATSTFKVESIGIKNNKSELAVIFSLDQTLNVRLKNDKFADIVVYNLIGQPVIKEKFSGSISRNLPVGAYIVKLQSGSEQQTTKLIIR